MAHMDLGSSSDAQALRLLRAFLKVEDRVLREKIVVLTESVSNGAAMREESQAPGGKPGQNAP